ncbi:hypothetical protein ACFWY9_34695 [Amycolatopsis sp. NPDC059027]|uniref:hypothetical protein n=1 Tax=unclassified Amycolatopsis TaxID=2618356 RepID=UPI00366EB69D
MTVTRAAAPRHRSILLLLVVAFFLFADATPELPGGPGGLTAKAAVVAQQTVPHHVAAHPIPPVDVPRAATAGAARPGFGEVLAQHTPVVVRRPAHAAEARAPPTA